MPLDLTAIIASAAVGCIAGSAIPFVGAWFERRSRRKELLLGKAVELAIHRFESVSRLAKDSGQKATLQDPAVLSATYFKWLEHIVDTGELPKEAKEAQEKKSDSV